ncbi:CaiB/BaiF CoA-transferase family protein [Cupriavidus sp. D384]|uniref:CaiB/BaiF CoA transferase family protein n=1 Tax=Cupriavidus sp. D384 TaxID=1538095 RepID=UPI00082BDCA9|nr:CaiB/BaiF CoA-transferase family protein [Cupriavidus sp. D384]
MKQVASSDQPVGGPAPLAGLRVLDMSRVLAGPWAAQQLGDLGADVVKIEAPGLGDDARQLGVAAGDADAKSSKGRNSNFYLACNRNKRSIVVDLSKTEGKSLVLELVRNCDVIVENFKAGGMARLGLGWDVLSEANPRLIHCSVTGFGQDGPYAAQPAYDFIMQAMTGMMSTCGLPDGLPGATPVRTAIPVTDLVTGYQATVAIMGALIQRAVTGKGQFIDAAMLDASVAFNVHLAQGYLMGLGVPSRQGNNNPIAAPSGVFQSSDGWLVIAAGNDRQFASLCSVLELDAIRDKEEFSSNAARVRNRAELHTYIEPVVRSQSSASLRQRLQSAGVPCTKINDMEATFEDVQVRHRQMVVHVSQAEDGAAVPILRSALNMSNYEVTYKAPPMLGQHTAEVLKEWGGVDEAGLRSLVEAQAVVL